MSRRSISKEERRRLDRKRKAAEVRASEALRLEKQARRRRATNKKTPSFFSRMLSGLGLSRVFSGLGRVARRVLPSAVTALVGSLILTMTVMAGGASASSKKDTSVKSKTGTSQRADFLAQEKAATEALIAEVTGQAPAPAQKQAPAAPKAEVKEVKADVSAPAQPQAAPQTEAKVSPDQKSILDAFVAAEIASLRAKETKQPVAQKMESSHPSAKISKATEEPAVFTISTEAETSLNGTGKDYTGEKSFASIHAHRTTANGLSYRFGIASDVSVYSEDGVKFLTKDGKIDKTGRRFVGTEHTYLSLGLARLLGPGVLDVELQGGVLNGGLGLGALADFDHWKGEARRGVGLRNLEALYNVYKNLRKGKAYEGKILTQNLFQKSSGTEPFLGVVAKYNFGLFHVDLTSSIGTGIDSMNTVKASTLDAFVQSGIIIKIGSKTPPNLQSTGAPFDSKSPWRWSLFAGVSRRQDLMNRATDKVAPVGGQNILEGGLEVQKGGASVGIKFTDPLTLTPERGYDHRTVGLFAKYSF